MSSDMTLILCHIITNLALVYLFFKFIFYMFVHFEVLFKFCPMYSFEITEFANQPQFLLLAAFELVLGWRNVVVVSTVLTSRQEMSSKLLLPITRSNWKRRLIATQQISSTALNVKSQDASISSILAKPQILWKHVLEPIVLM